MGSFPSWDRWFFDLNTLLFSELLDNLQWRSKKKGFEPNINPDHSKSTISKAKNPSLEIE